MSGSDHSSQCQMEDVQEPVKWGWNARKARGDSLAMWARPLIPSTADPIAHRLSISAEPGGLGFPGGWFTNVHGA